MAYIAALTMAATFNLICAGTETSGILNVDHIENSEYQPFNLVLRIDLIQHRWCEAACTEAEAISATLDDRLELTDDRTDSSSKQFFVNRENGKMLRREQGGSFLDVKTGVCEQSSFTGFPARKF